MKIEFLQEIDSTNDYIRRYLNKSEDVIVCAERQNGGKGTKGRSFISERGGVYLSKLKFYENFPANEAFKIMSHAAVAVCKTVEHFGAIPEIKWANDIFVNQKKICGILIENILENDCVRASITGIGLNVWNDLKGLEQIATRLKDVSPKALTVEQVLKVLIEELDRETKFEEYLSYIKFLRKKIKVCEAGKNYFAVARNVLSDGRLEIEQDGNIRALSSAEISIQTGREE